MTELTTPGVIPAEIWERIAQSEDRSDEYATRYRVTFRNGYELSLIHGRGTYGAGFGLWEIAVIHSDEFVGRELFPDGFEYDDVLGWQSVEQVVEWMRKVSLVGKEVGA